MSNIVNEIIQRAKSNKKTIVLPEGNETRIQRAAVTVQKNNIANVILIGNFDEIKTALGDDAECGIVILDPKTYEKVDSFSKEFYEMRKSKGLTLEKADYLIKNDPLYFGSMLLNKGLADGMVAGSINSTGSVLRAGLQIVKTAKNIKTVSSIFVMVLPENSSYQHKVMVFGDCAVNPTPNAQQLAEIAYASINSAKLIAEIEKPNVALLSYSTKGSANTDDAKRVQEAVEILSQMGVENCNIDGELQVDAALVPAVQRLKAPGSSVNGEANVLIFPDLQSGNIGYKLVERLAGAMAIGPICQGFAKPINDLSRGCSEDDVVAVVAITALQAQVER